MALCSKFKTLFDKLTTPAAKQPAQSDFTSDTLTIPPERPSIEELVRTLHAGLARNPLPVEFYEPIADADIDYWFPQEEPKKPHEQQQELQQQQDGETLETVNATQRLVTKTVSFDLEDILNKQQMQLERQAKKIKILKRQVNKLKKNQCNCCLAPAVSTVSTKVAIQQQQRQQQMESIQFIARSLKI
ncbi:hypothetical protein GQ42DRAFT_158322 [Ramicandelaber brevisporus]|nr:hypothetical protein GQ42DRAFT_158322 [Ramicandelaber brevisporus]